MANSNAAARRKRISRVTKKRWFDRGAAAFGSAFPHLHHVGYACPLCLRASTSLAAFSVEDVPPAFSGGRPLLLTCTKCNNEQGTRLDSHWARLLDIERFIRGEISEPLRVDMKFAGHRMAVQATAEGSTYQLRGIKAASDPAAVRGQLKALEAAHAVGETLPPFQITFTHSRFNERSARISILRAGYLMAVAVSGYRMVPGWSRIRNLIRDTNTLDDDLLNLVCLEEGQSLDRRVLADIREPEEMRCLYVGFGPWAVFIPWKPDCGLYKKEHRERQPWEFSGNSYEWPVAPSFGLDSDWESRQRASPVQQRS
jgi:hypothetical protein